MKFNPQPGDKIICNNGEEFVCCARETLDVLTTRFIGPNSKFFGYVKGESPYWMQWSDEELVADDAWGVKEIIPAVQQEVKQDVAEIVSVQEKTYTLGQIEEVFTALGWPVSFNRFCEKLNEPQDPEYKLYLELKVKFEGKE